MFCYMKTEADQRSGQMDVFHAGGMVMEQLDWAVSAGTELLTDELLIFGGGSEMDFYYGDSGPKNPGYSVQPYYPPLH